MLAAVRPVPQRFSSARGAPSWRRAAAVVAGVLIVVAVAGWRLLAADQAPRSAEAPPLGRVEIMRPADGLGSAVAGFGDVWMDDRPGERLIRVRTPDGRVLARIPVRGRLILAAGAGGVWALQSAHGFGPYLRGPLLHVDPDGARVRARIALRMPSGERMLGRGVVAGGGSVWVWGPRDILRVNPRTDAVVQRIAVADSHGDVAGVVPRGRWLVVATADGTLLRLDRATGAPLGTVQTALRSPAVRAVIGSRLIVASDGELAAVEVATGRVAWRRPLGFLVGGAVLDQGVLWAHSAAFNEPGDRLTGLDPATGRVVMRSILPAFGTTSIVAVDGRLVIPSADGRALVVAPLRL
jgi:outer membrane protein assembly factor BamB